MKYYNYADQTSNTVHRNTRSLFTMAKDKDQMLTKPERLSIGALAGRSSAATRVSWSLSTFLVVDERSEDDSDDHDGDADFF